MNEGGSEWLTVEQIATRMQVTPETVRRWLRRRELRGVRLSDKAGWRIQGAELDRYLAARETGPDAED